MSADDQNKQVFSFLRIFPIKKGKDGVVLSNFVPMYVGYLQSPSFKPPQQNSNAPINSKQVGLMQRLKFLILPPQQHKNNKMSKIQVQLQPPNVDPP